MRKTIFRITVVVDAPIDAVYAFHENPHNLVHVSPPGLDIRAIEANPEAVVGERFWIDARMGLLPVRWEGAWDEVEAPRRLVDRAVRSPFSEWRHLHLFESTGIGTQTRMTDQIEYVLPLEGPARLLAETFLTIAFTIGFRIRHVRTKAWFAGVVAGKPAKSVVGRTGWLIAGISFGILLTFAWNRSRRKISGSSRRDLS